MSVETITPKAQQLFDAQVTFILNQLSGEQLTIFLESNIDALLNHAKKIKLKDVVTAESVKKTAIKYASEMEIGPGIPEIVGEISAEIYHHKLFDEHTPGDIVKQQDIKEVLTKIAEMEDLRKRLISEVVGNPMYASLMSDLLYHGIQDYITDNPLAKKIPGAQSMMKFGKSMVDKASPNLEVALKKYVASNIRATLKESERFLNKNLTNEKIVELGLDAWLKIEDNKLSVFRKYITPTDIDEAFVTTFEFWKHYRVTDVYKDCIKAGVDFFFKKYGGDNLFDIIQDMGVTREMFLDDAITFAPQALEFAKEQGMLEALIRQNLAPFFASKTVRSILGE